MTIGLLCCEMVARRGKPMIVQLHDMFAKVGSFYLMRENFRLTPRVKAKFTEKLRTTPRGRLGRRVREINSKDGTGVADRSWVCYRPSGTEPVVRVYAEGRSESDLAKLSAAARKWIFE